MTDATIHIGKIIDILEVPECCGSEMSTVMYHGYTEPEKRIKDRPNDLSCWLCDSCLSAWYPLIEDEKLVMAKYIRPEDDTIIVDALKNLKKGAKWFDEDIA